MSPALAGRFFTTSTTWEARHRWALVTSLAAFCKEGGWPWGSHSLRMHLEDSLWSVLQSLGPPGSQGSSVTGRPESCIPTCSADKDSLNWGNQRREGGIMR